LVNVLESLPENVRDRFNFVQFDWNLTTGMILCIIDEMEKLLCASDSVTG